MLDTYGFITDCDPCIKDGLKKMNNKNPLSTEGIEEARKSFGPLLWQKYKKDYLYYAKYYSKRKTI